MPTIWDIKYELKRLGIKGITKKTKDELMSMLPKEHQFHLYVPPAHRPPKLNPEPVIVPETKKGKK